MIRGRIMQETSATERAKRDETTMENVHPAKAPAAFGAASSRAALTSSVPPGGGHQTIASKRRNATPRANDQ